MKIIPFALALAATGLNTLVAQAHDGWLYVQNEARATISGVWISPDTSANWGSDQLRQDIPSADGDWVPVPGSVETCYFDIRIYDQSGYTGEYWGRNLCADNTIIHR